MATQSTTWNATLAKPNALKWIKFVLLGSFNDIDFTREAATAGTEIVRAIKAKDLASCDIDANFDKIIAGFPEKKVDAYKQAGVMNVTGDWKKFFAAACYKFKIVDGNEASKSMVEKAIADASAKGYRTAYLSELLDEIEQAIADANHTGTPKHSRAGTDTNHLYRKGNERHHDYRPVYVDIKATQKSYAPSGELGVYWLQSVRVKGSVKTPASYAHIAPIMQRRSEPFQVRYDRSGRGAQEMICYFFDRASAVSFRDQCEDPMNKPSNVDFVDIKFRKPDANGYFEVETEFGKCYIEARRLHEEIEAGEEPLAEETEPIKKPARDAWKDMTEEQCEAIDKFEEALYAYDN